MALEDHAHLLHQGAVVALTCRTLGCVMVRVMGVYKYNVFELIKLVVNGKMVLQKRALINM